MDTQSAKWCATASRATTVGITKASTGSSWPPKAKKRVVFKFDEAPTADNSPPPWKTIAVATSARECACTGPDAERSGSATAGQRRMNTPETQSGGSLKPVGSDFLGRHVWFGPALAIAQHEDRKRSWPWYGRLQHWLFVSWRCPCCKAAKERFIPNKEVSEGGPLIPESKPNANPPFAGPNRQESDYETDHQRRIRESDALA